MARRVTIVDLTQRRDRLERRVLRIVRGVAATGESINPLFRVAWDLVECDEQIANLERAARREIRKLAR